MFASGAKAWERLGIQGNVGANFALDSDNDSSIFHYSAHADYEIYENLFPILELNGITTFDNGNRTAGDFEGFDLLNFGSTDSGDGDHPCRRRTLPDKRHRHRRHRLRITADRPRGYHQLEVLRRPRHHSFGVSIAPARGAAIANVWAFA